MRLCVAHGKGKYWPFTSEKNAFRKHVSRCMLFSLFELESGAVECGGALYLPFIICCLNLVRVVMDRRRQLIQNRSHINYRSNKIGTRYLFRTVVKRYRR